MFTAEIVGANRSPSTTGTLKKKNECHGVTKHQPVAAASGYTLMAVHTR